jgi:hypothetical protein
MRNRRRNWYSTGRLMRTNQIGERQKLPKVPNFRQSFSRVRRWISVTSGVRFHCKSGISYTALCNVFQHPASVSFRYTFYLFA